MSKFRAILWVLVGFATIITSYGQNVEVKVDGSPYLGITSYNGGLTSGALNVYIEQSYGVNMDIENWKMSKPTTLSWQQMEQFSQRKKFYSYEH